MAEAQPSKTCSKCGVWKPISAFHRSGPSARRLMEYASACKACTNPLARERAKRRSPEERRRERARAAEKAGRVYLTREERTERSRTRVQLQLAAALERIVPEREAAAAFRWWWLNCSPDQRRRYVNAKSRAHYAANRSKQVARVQGYKRRRPDRRKSWEQRRRERMAIVGGLTSRELKVIREEASRCFYCLTVLTSKNRTIDHMQPICLGGANDRANVVACCRACNQAKGYRSWTAWFQQLPAHHQARIRTDLSSAAA